MEKTLTFLSLGGVGIVTRNMYLYELGNEILIVDCGIGFVNDVPGVDFILPDVTPLLDKLKEGKRIVGIAITHGHEDHLGALPYILPQLPSGIPIFGTSITLGFIEEKLRDFKLNPDYHKLQFGSSVQIGSFKLTPIHVTHSVPETSQFFIETSAGNFYHAADYKFDLTPFDGRISDLPGIALAGSKGIRCMISDSLGSERPGWTPSEMTLTENFDKIFLDSTGKIFVTTYSSHINRIAQISSIAERYGRKVVFVGRSLLKAKKIGQTAGRLKFSNGFEVPMEKMNTYRDNELLIFVAGSQGQEESALTRIVNGQHQFVKLGKDDCVVFSAEPIPGNETAVFGLVDAIADLGVKSYFSTHNAYHVSGHGSASEILLMMQLLHPKEVMPISGNARHRKGFAEIAQGYGIHSKNILLPKSGEEIVFGDHTRIGKVYPVRNVYVDEVSREEVSDYVLRDRQKIAEDGVVVIIAEVSQQEGVLASPPQVIIRGLPDSDKMQIEKFMPDLFKRTMQTLGRNKDTNYVSRETRKEIENMLAKQINRHPLVVPIIIAV